jgi:ACS family sodium-dependent inorganic phosphate cotransporter
MYVRAHTHTCTHTAMLLQALFTIFAAHAPNALLAVASITVAIGLGGVAWSAFSVNHLDIAPQVRACPRIQ